MRIKGNTILITGGATGIGFALAEHFINAGNEVVICGRRADKLSEAKEKLPKVHIKVCDVSKDDERKELIDWTNKKFPAFNILVNNAGIQKMIFMKQENSTERISSEVITNLIAPVHLTNLAVSSLSKQKEAAVVNITSGLAFIPLAIAPVYCATKAALHSFCLSTRHQLKDTPIKIFEIIPPIVETELGRDDSRSDREVHGIQPSEVATETLKALAEDNYEAAVGEAVNLYNAAHSDKEKFVFGRIND
ncbi:MAG: SDR family oxidoreductase [Elusimicrobiota bacterium]